MNTIRFAVASARFCLRTAHWGALGILLTSGLTLLANETAATNTSSPPEPHAAPNTAPAPTAETQEAATLVPPPGMETSHPVSDSTAAHPVDGVPQQAPPSEHSDKPHANTETNATSTSPAALSTVEKSTHPPDHAAHTPAPAANTPASSTTTQAKAEPAHGDTHAAQPHAADAPAANQPTATEQLSQLAIVRNLLSRNEAKDAEASLIVILQTTTDSETQVQALLIYGKLLAKEGRYPEAVITLEKYVKIGSNRTDLPQVFLELGRIYREMGAYEMSMKRFYNVLNSTIRLANDQLDSYRSLSQLAKFEIAETYAIQGDYTNARKFFSRIQVLDLPPADRVRAAFREAQTAYQDSEYGRAAPLLRQFLRDYEGHPSTLEAGYMLSVALRNMNLYEDSLRETLNLLKMAKSSEKISDDQWIYWQKRAGNQLANSFYVQGEYANALALYQALARLKNEPLWLWPVQYQIGLCYERLNQAEKATQIYESIVKASKENAEWETKYMELREVRETAEWRLEHLKWLDKTQTNLRTIRPAEVVLAAPRS
ncbi:MAG: tetratricopeptide repeat protein [Verrucomicrobiota bacterium]|nr:tetratricopeptide repeat protein [Verrucomicrobiota bacterium]